MALRLPVHVLLAVGLVGVAASTLLAIRTGTAIAILESATLPAAFLVAGALGGLAHPEHPGIRLLLVLGSSHLAAFALTGWAVEVGPRVLRWSMGAVGDAAYVSGFVALAVLLACYPVGRPETRLQRVFSVAAIAAGATVLVSEVLLSGRLALAAGSGVSSVIAPPPLPLIALQIDLLPVLLATVPASLVVLAVSARRKPDRERRASGWAVLAAALLAAMIVASPAADVLVPGAWDWAFPLATVCVPFLLLAGLVRYRLLEVDVLVVRTLARGALVLVVLAVMSAAVATLDAGGAAAVGAALTIAAVLGGSRLLVLLERLADRVTVGGRVRRDALRRTLRLLPGDDPEEACRLIADGLDARWVLIRTSGSEYVVGTPTEAPAVRLQLRTPNADVGDLECGPRRGGWSPAEVDLLDAISVDLGLRLRDAVLSERLREQVRALEESRLRLLQAEDTTRRRVERDLHDGAQQQIVALMTRIALAREQVTPGTPVAITLAAADELAKQTLSDLRVLVSGIAPPLLGTRGLIAAVSSRAALLPIDVTLDADPRLAEERFQPEVEGAAYFVVTEALANVMKHSGSGRARVVVTAASDGIQVAVVDDGDGRADPAGSGLSGLRDRVEGLGGRFRVLAVPGVGTTITAELPTGRVGADA